MVKAGLPRKVCTQTEPWYALFQADRASVARRWGEFGGYVLSVRQADLGPGYPVTGKAVWMIMQLHMPCTIPCCVMTNRFCGDQRTAQDVRSMTTDFSQRLKATWPEIPDVLLALLDYLLENLDIGSGVLGAHIREVSTLALDDYLRYAVDAVQSLLSDQALDFL